MILTIQTAGMQTELGLLNGKGQAVKSVNWESGRELSDKLLAKIEELLTSCSTSIDRLTGIVVYEGPGSFTSLRIGITVANSLAYARHIPVVSAGGHSWKETGLKDLGSAKLGRFAVPKYGAEANITHPKA